MAVVEHTYQLQTGIRPIQCDEHVESRSVDERAARRIHNDLQEPSPSIDHVRALVFVMCTLQYTPVVSGNPFSTYFREHDTHIRREGETTERRRSLSERIHSWLKAHDQPDRRYLARRVL